MNEILDRLAQALPGLSGKLAQAARFALDRPDRIALASMRQAASECGVTSPTMLRLSRQVGYQSYNDFRGAFQETLLSEGFGARAGALRESGAGQGQASLVGRIAEAAIGNIERSLGGLDQAALTRMVETVMGEGTTYLVASSSAHWVAVLLQSTARMALPGLRVPRADTGFMLDSLGAIGPGDSVLGISIAPYARSTVEALRFAKQRGATTLAITDKRSSPLLEFSDCWLLAGTESPHFYPSWVTVVALTEVLLASIVSQSDQSVLDQIRDMERLRQQSGEYILPGGR